MDVRTLKDSTGAVFSPKVSTESVYLKSSTTTLDSKLSSMDTSIGEKVDKDALSSVATSGSYNDLSDKPTIPDVSGFIPNYGSSMSLGNGTACTIPESLATDTVYSWMKAQSGQRDTNVMYSSADGTFFANSGDCGYVFAIYNTDVTTDGNFANTSEPIFKVNDTGGSSYCVARYGFQAPGFYVSSLRSLKENIEPSSINAVNLINPQEIVNFNYKADEDKQTKVGLIADDSDPLFLDKKKETVDLYNTCGILMKAVQELSKKVDKLEQLIDTLK